MIHIIKILLIIFLLLLVVNNGLRLNAINKSNSLSTFGLKMKINPSSSKYDEEMLKIERDKLELRKSEIEIEKMKISSAEKVKMMELNYTKEMHKTDSNAKKFQNVILVFAIISFSIFGTQLTNALLGKVTTSATLLQSFYELGLDIKMQVGKIAEKIYYFIGIIGFAKLISIIFDDVIKVVHFTWRMISSKFLRIIRR